LDVLRFLSFKYSVAQLAELQQLSVCAAALPGVLNAHAAF